MVNKGSWSWRCTAYLKYHNMNEPYSFLKALNDFSSTFSERLGIFAESFFLSKALVFATRSNGTGYQYEQGMIFKRDVFTLPFRG